MQLTPTSDDVLSTRREYLPMNLVKATYDSFDHYAKVQYQLLWEDFLYSLRDGMILLEKYFQTGNKKWKKDAGKFLVYYTNVQLVKVEGAKLQLVFPKSDKNTKGDKTLTSGSLLYLSDDKFRSITTVIIENDPEEVVIVRLRDIEKITLQRGVKFDVVENKAYFRAYEPFLNCLNCMTTWRSPSLIDYILGRDCYVRLPNYTQCNAVYTFRNCKSQIVNNPVANITKWCRADDLGLNEGQRKALHLALTQNIAVIQGPPGTGKTFLGVKIVETLLLNRRYWENLGPILLICCTNHALDQFLEKIVDVIGLKPFQLVRFGSRSGSEKLESYNIGHLRKNRQVRSDVRKYYNEREEIEDLQKDAMKAFVRNHAEANRKIMDENCLRDVITKEHYQSLVRQCSETDSAMVLWLGEAILKMMNKAAKMTQGRYQLGKSDDIVSQMSEAGWNVKGIQKQINNMFNDILQKDNQASGEYMKKVRNVWNLSAADRWRMYLFWLNDWRQEYTNDLRRLINRYEDNKVQIAREHAVKDEVLLNDNTLIMGMTTTGAAMNRELLDNIRPGIVIVEEAAEVIESHVVTALSENCRHLILIGDHKQLRPHVNCNELACNNATEISFFERMIENGLPYATLTLQHRMRPRIAELLVPNIYDTLDSHPRVYKYEEIRGIQSSVFFVDHKFDFLDNKPNESTSFVNVKEAQLAIALCGYLLQRKYLPSQITILTAYKGQIQELQKFAARNGTLKDVLITTVDNYQGEENDIIILSLVRSNLESQVGFLKIENRVCVALSRARMGLYAIGNFQMLSNVPVWRPIINSMRRDNLIGPVLRVFCLNHPNVKYDVRVAEDFSKVPKGDCGLPCEYIYPLCGHRCQLLCHHVDIKHVRACTMKCERKCPQGHQCAKPCRELCAPCILPVQRIHPVCSHLVTILCRDYTLRDFSKVKCLSMVTVRLDCGHSNTVPCYKSKNRLKCSEPCPVTLSCGHKCLGTCDICSPRNGIQVHQMCDEKCCKLLLCGHHCQLPCSEECLKCVDACGLSCSHQTCELPCEATCVPCTKPCTWVCPHHSCTKLCYEPCNRPWCDHICLKLLPCSHRCLGMCGEPCPTACRQCNPEDFTQYPPFISFVLLTDCGHLVPVDELDSLMSVSQKSVGFMKCPQCNACVRNSVRYGNQVKETRKLLVQIRGHLRYGLAKNKEFKKTTVISSHATHAMMVLMEVCRVAMDNVLMKDTDLITWRKITQLVRPLCSNVKHSQVSDALDALSSWVKTWQWETRQFGFDRLSLQQLYLRINRVRLMKQLLIIRDKKNYCLDEAMEAYRDIVDGPPHPFDKEILVELEKTISRLAKKSKLAKKDDFLQGPSLLFSWNCDGWKKCDAGHAYQSKTGDEPEECPECSAKRPLLKRCVVQ